MKLTDRKEMIREVFTDLELSEIRAALSDRYDVLTKMAEKEEKHGRRYDDRSWPRERLAILDGDGMRAGVIDVFNPKSADAKNGELFDDEEEEDPEEVSISSMVDRPNAITAEYENDPASCPHTEILDETEEGEAPRFRCTLCGEEIRALGAPAGDSGDTETIEADYEIVDERSEEERAQDPEPGPFVPIPPIPTLEELDALTLEELGVPTRARNVLARRGIKTAADYLAAGDAVLRMPGVGDITLNEINQALRARGLTEGAAREIEAQLVAQGRAFVGAMGGGETAEVQEEPAGTLYDRVLSVTCPSCTNHGIGAGEICVSVGGNPRNGFHADRLRAAIRAGVIARDEYDAAYAIQTNPGAAAGSAHIAAAHLARQVDEQRLQERAESVASGNGYRATAPSGSLERRQFEQFVQGYCTGFRGDLESIPTKPSGDWNRGYNIGLTDRGKARAGDTKAGYPFIDAAPTEEEAPEDVQASEDTLPWEQVGLALGNGKPEGPEEIVILESMEWPEGPPMIDQQIRDLRRGNDPHLGRQLVIGAVSERFITLMHPETGRPIGSLRVEDVRWSPTLGCWAWGAPAAAGV